MILINKFTEQAKEVYEYRRLVYFFTWREFKVRYKQTFLGIFWVSLQPLVFMGIVQLIIIRGFNADFGVDNIPAYIMVFLGFIVWIFFESSFSGSVNSFVNNQGLYKKIYFPKIIPAISFVISRMIDLVIGFMLLFVLSAVLGYKVHLLGVLLILPLVMLMGVAALGLGTLIGTLNVKYRDIKIILPFFVRVAFLSTPVFWPIGIVPDNLHKFIYLNPAAASIQTLRQGFYQPDKIEYLWLIGPIVITLVIFIIGFAYFIKKDKEMVDIV